jgi:endo-alpha-1,4-polygalactosaminidase (GH114 family)
MAVTMPTEDEWQLYCQEKWDLEKPMWLLEEFPDVWAENRPPARLTVMHP